MVRGSTDGKGASAGGRKRILKHYVYPTMSDNKLDDATFTVLVDGIERIIHKADIVAMNVGYKLLKEDLRALPNALGDGLALVQQAQRFQLWEELDMAASDIFGVNKFMVSGMTLLLDVVNEMRTHLLEERWQALLGSPLAAKYVAWDAKTTSWLQDAEDKLARLREPFDHARQKKQ